MRSIKIITAAALLISLALSAQAAPQLDAQGKCRNNGKFVAASMCKAPAAAKPQKCRDAKGKFVKCDAPGAKPAK